MTLANWLTLARILSLPAALYFTLRGPILGGFIAFVLGWATDLLDGYLARSRREVTPLGKVLDPLADKLLFLGVFSVFSVRGEIPWWGVVLFAVPQAGLGVGALYLYLARKAVGSAGIPGKAAAGVTVLAVLGLYAGPVGFTLGDELFFAAVVANFLSALHYLARLLRATPGARGEEGP